MDRCIAESWLWGLEDVFTQLLFFILSENVPVDSQVYTYFSFSMKMQYVVHIVTIMCVILCVCCKLHEYILMEFWTLSPKF